MRTPQAATGKGPLDCLRLAVAQLIRFANCRVCQACVERGSFDANPRQSASAARPPALPTVGYLN